MTSWTVEVRWREDLRGRDGIDRFMAILDQDLGSLHAELASGTVTAILTQGAGTLPQAMRVALDRAEVVAGRTVALRRIVATEVYSQTLTTAGPRRRARARASTICYRPT